MYSIELGYFTGVGEVSSSKVILMSILMAIYQLFQNIIFINKKSFWEYSVFCRIGVLQGDVGIVSYNFGSRIIGNTIIRDLEPYTVGVGFRLGVPSRGLNISLNTLLYL